MSCAAHGLALSRNFLKLEDVDLIAEITKLLPKNSRVIDLGAGSGTTALSVFSARTDLRVFTVDHHPEAIWSTEQCMKNAGFHDYWTGVILDSVLAFSLVPYEYDLLMIDTSHEEEQTFQELTTWWPNLKPGGYMWCHDYTDDYPGVEKALNRYLTPEARLYDQRGLGVAFRKVNNVPSASSRS